MLGTLVKQLLTSVSDHGAQHLNEVEIDLDQTAVLLGEAIEKLGASFMALHASVCAQQEIVDQLSNGAVLTPKLAEKLHALQLEIGRHVNSAITGLQFQDMTNQLIGRTTKRVSGLREVLGTLGTRGAELLPHSTAGAVEALLGEVNSELAEQSARLESVSWKAVSQTHMDSGDIELF